MLRIRFVLLVLLLLLLLLLLLRWCPVDVPFMVLHGCSCFSICQVFRFFCPVFFSFFHFNFFIFWVRRYHFLVEGMGERGVRIRVLLVVLVLLLLRPLGPTGVPFIFSFFTGSLPCAFRVAALASGSFSQPPYQPSGLSERHLHHVAAAVASCGQLLLTVADCFSSSFVLVSHSRHLQLVLLRCCSSCACFCSPPVSQGHDVERVTVLFKNSCR